MWLRLDDQQSAFLAELLDREIKVPCHVDAIGRSKLQAILDTMNEEPDPDAAAFMNCVCTSDDLEVDGDAIISRGDEGAFVMTWSWVSNEDAGIETNDQDDD